MFSKTLNMFFFWLYVGYMFCRMLYEAFNTLTIITHILYVRAEGLYASEAKQEFVNHGEVGVLLQLGVRCPL